MPEYLDVKKIADGLVALIQELVNTLRTFIDGLKKNIKVGPAEEEAE